MESFQVGGISLFRESFSSDIDKCTSDSVISPKFLFMLLYIVGSMTIYYSFFLLIVAPNVKCFPMIHLLRYCKTLHQCDNIF